MSENGEIYTADKNFTLPPAVTALTNSTSVQSEEKGSLPAFRIAPAPKRKRIPLLMIAVVTRKKNSWPADAKMRAALGESS